MALKDNRSVKSKNIFDSFKHAFDGLWYGFKNTRNLHIDLIFFVIVLNKVLKAVNISSTIFLVKELSLFFIIL